MLSWLIPKKSGQSHFFQFRMPWEFREIPNFVLGYLPLKSNFSKNFFCIEFRIKLRFGQRKCSQFLTSDSKVMKHVLFLEHFYVIRCHPISVNLKGSQLTSVDCITVTMHIRSCDLSLEYCLKCSFCFRFRLGKLNHYPKR